MPRTLLTLAAPAVTRFFLHRSESNVTQNDKPFNCHKCCEVCAVSYRSVIASTVRCVAIRSLLKGRRILSRFAFRMTGLFVIAVRVSGGHLCEAEAPTEPAGETAVRCAAIA